MIENIDLVKIIEDEVNCAIGGNGAGSGSYGGGSKPFTSEQLSIERAMELDYYNGQPFGNEREGESTVVSSDVFDAVESMLPHLMKTFTASDDAVEFEPVGMEDEDAAKQRTDACNYVFYKQNNGFVLMYTWFKDALLQKNGIVKYWWDKSIRKSEEEYAGLTEGEYLTLVKDANVEVLEHSTYDDPTAAGQKAQMIEKLQAQAQANPQAAMLLQQISQAPVPQLHDIKVVIERDESKICIQPVPPEQFGISAKHTCISIQDTPFCYHREKKTFSDLKEMGCPADILAEIESDDPTEDARPEVLARNRFIDESATTITDDDSLREVWVVDCFIHLDVDGDGIAELRHIIMPGRTIWINEPCEHINFAAITPIIMPHRWIGKSVAETVMDFQFQNSVLLRQMFNNLYLTNNPQKVVLGTAGGQVYADLDRLMTSRVGGVLVEYQPNAIRNQEVPFVAGASFPMLEYLEGKKEQRTGNTRYNQGTDADSLNKMLDIHTEVPLADGSFKILRDINDGDILIGTNGPTKVLKAHEIQDPARAYRMVFASGEEVFAGGEHLWTVMTERDHAARVSRTITTDAVYQRKQTCAENLYVPRLQRPKFGGGELPVDPYLLGCWLGDGTSAKSAITTMDDGIVEAFRADGWNMYHDRTQNSGQAITWCIGCADASVMQDGTTGRMVATGSAWLSKMTQLGVARNKHIPDQYLRASYEDRLELLRGLMDTDGCHHSGALVIFSQKNGRLLADTVRLIEGLGGWPSMSHQSRPETGKDGQTYWNVTFHIFDNPFRLPRKALKWRAPERNAISQPIISVEPVDIRPMRCLTVDANDGLFCVGHRMTLTHNTARGISLIQSAAQQKIDLVARIFAETGVKDLFRGIAYLLSKYSSKAMTIRLRGKWVDIDPREWKNQFDMTVNVGLGTGNKDAQLIHLTKMNEVQLQLMQSGRGYMVTDQNVYNLSRKIAENMGFKHPDIFITDPQQVQKPPPQPNPDMIKIQAETKIDQAKIQSNEKIRQFDAQTQKRLEEIKAQTQLAIAEIDRQTKLAIADMQAKTQVQIALFKENNALKDEATSLDLKQKSISFDESLLTIKKQMDSEKLSNQERVIESAAGAVSEGLNQSMAALAQGMQQQAETMAKGMAAQAAALSQTNAVQGELARSVAELAKNQANTSKATRRHKAIKTDDGGFEITSTVQ